MISTLLSPYIYHLTVAHAAIYVLQIRVGERLLYVCFTSQTKIISHRFCVRGSNFIAVLRDFFALSV